jgi:plastocyanin
MRLAPVHAITRPRLRGVAVLALLIGALIAAGCGGSSNDKSPGSPATTAPPAAAPTTAAGTSGGSIAATIQNFAFHPATATTKVRQKVAWKNTDKIAHTVTADNGSFDSGDLNPGASFSSAFAKSGTVKYHCSIHTFMHGTVQVS